MGFLLHSSNRQIRYFEVDHDLDHLQTDRSDRSRPRSSRSYPAVKICCPRSVQYQIMQMIRLPPGHINMSQIIQTRSLSIFPKSSRSYGSYRSYRSYRSSVRCVDFSSCQPYTVFLVSCVWVLFDSAGTELSKRGLNEPPSKNKWLNFTADSSKMGCCTE